MATRCARPSLLICSLNFSSQRPAPAISTLIFDWGANETILATASIKWRWPFSGDNLPTARMTLSSGDISSARRVASDFTAAEESDFMEFGTTTTRSRDTPRLVSVLANSAQTVTTKSEHGKDHLSN